MDKLTGFIKTSSWLLFLAALIWSYASLPPQVAYRVDTEGSPIAVMTKGNFFFASLAFFLLVNIVCIIFLRMVKKVDSTEDGTGLRNRSLKKDIMSWTNGFIGILNLFFALILFFITYLNGVEEFQASYLGGIVYIGPVLLIIWFFYLVKLLAKKRD